MVSVQSGPLQQEVIGPSRLFSQWERTTHTDREGAITHLMRRYNASQRSTAFWRILVGGPIIRTNQVNDGISTGGFIVAKQHRLLCQLLEEKLENQKQTWGGGDAAES